MEDHGWIRGSAASDAGPVRAHNEDACLFHAEAEGALVVVADGMGAARSGRDAADLAVETCLRVFAARLDVVAESWWNAEHGPTPALAWDLVGSGERRAIRERVRRVLDHRQPETVGDAMLLEQESQILAEVARRGLELANRRIHHRGTVDAMWRGHGSTGIAGVFHRGAVGLGHVGDSRIGRFREGVLEPLTVEHSLLQDYLNHQPMTAEEIEAFPHKNVIVRALGMQATVVVDTSALAVLPGDLFLFASDGLGHALEDPEIAAILEEHGAGAAPRLVTAACDRNVSDNVTVAVVELGQRA